MPATSRRSPWESRFLSSVIPSGVALFPVRGLVPQRQIFVRGSQKRCRLVMTRRARPTTGSGNATSRPSSRDGVFERPRCDLASPARLDRLHVARRQLDALLAAQQRQQDDHPLVRGHAGHEKPRCPRNGPPVTRTRPPGRSRGGGSGSSITPFRSLPRSSSITRSGTRAGRSPSITSRVTPGAVLAACHWSSITRNR